MDKLMAIVLIILGIVGAAVAVVMALFTWAINETSKEEQQEFHEYVLRNGVIMEDHDVSGLIEED